MNPELEFKTEQDKIKFQEILQQGQENTSRKSGVRYRN